MTIDVVHFKEVTVNEDKEGTEGPVTIWIGVIPQSTSAMVMQLMLC
jgi:hypothetical protein